MSLLLLTRMECTFMQTESKSARQVVVERLIQLSISTWEAPVFMMAQAIGFWDP